MWLWGTCTPYIKLISHQQVTPNSVGSQQRTYLFRHLANLSYGPDLWSAGPFGFRQLQIFLEGFGGMT